MLRPPDFKAMQQQLKESELLGPNIIHNSTFQTWRIEYSVRGDTWVECAGEGFIQNDDFYSTDINSTCYLVASAIFMTEQKAEKILKQIDSVQTYQHTECWELSRQWSVLLPQRLNWTFTREQPGSSPGQTIRWWPENFRVAIHVWKRVMEKKSEMKIKECRALPGVCDAMWVWNRSTVSVNFKRLNNKKEPANVNTTYTGLKALCRSEE